jgi:beta-phosphoglucomutase-like phosphatase (HAD superfamily)
VIWAIDFDGVVVRQEGRRYDDVYTPLELMPGAREGLAALRRAEHVLVLYSGRANRALLGESQLDPLVRAGVRPPTDDRSRRLAAARLRQMLDFVAAELPGVFHAIDDGVQGKPAADVYLDDRGIRFGGPDGVSWSELAAVYGEPSR